MLYYEIGAVPFQCWKTLVAKQPTTMPTRRVSTQTAPREAEITVTVEPESISELALMLQTEMKVKLSLATHHPSSLLHSHNSLYCNQSTPLFSLPFPNNFTHTYVPMLWQGIMAESTSLLSSRTQATQTYMPGRMEKVFTCPPCPRTKQRTFRLYAHSGPLDTSRPR